MSSVEESGEEAAQRWQDYLNGAEDELVASVTFLVWGGRRNWQDGNKRMQWKEMMGERSNGTQLLRYYHWAREDLLLEEVKAKSNEREGIQPLQPTTGVCEKRRLNSASGGRAMCAT